MQREIQSLTDKLQAVKVGGGARRKPKKTGPLNPSVVMTTGSASGGRRRKNKKLKIGNGAGTITFNRLEKVEDVDIPAKLAKNSGYFDICPSSFTFLKKFVMFDKVRWNKLRLFYKPGVGATFNGFVSYGVLWEFGSTSADRSQISALTPNISHAIWYDGQASPLNLPQAKLQTRPWYTPDETTDTLEKGPGRVFWCVESSAQANAIVVGEIWAEYSITMTGTAF